MAQKKPSEMNDDEYAQWADQQSHAEDAEDAADTGRDTDENTAR